MHRFYLPTEELTKKIPVINDKQVIKHARNVLRLQKGEQVEVFNGKGDLYMAEILLLTKREMQLQILEERKAIEQRSSLCLALGLAKNTALATAVRMSAELGTAELRLFDSEYSVIKVDNISANKLERMERIAVEASRQSENLHVPKIHKPVVFEEIISVPADAKILLHSRSAENTVDLHHFNSLLKEGKKVLAMIGPEGGFSKREISLAIDSGFRLVHLNLPVLRVETAVAATASILLS